MPVRVKMPKRRPSTASHNSALSAKVEVRRWLIGELGGMSAVSVLDCFCAAGMLWGRAYERTSRYLGLDKRRFDDERATVMCDSRRFLRHVDADLQRFNLFDLDAFGSPLEHLALICSRVRVSARAQRVGFVVTDGTGFNARMNSSPSGLLAYLGMSRHRGTKVQAVYRTEMFNAAVAKSMAAARLRVVDSRGAEKSGTNTEMRYVALLAEGLEG